MHKLYLKERDDEMLRYLELMEYATVYNLGRLVPRAVNEYFSTINTSQKLKRIKDQLGYVDINKAVRLGFPYVYFLTKKGKEYLDTNFGKVHTSAIWNSSSWKHDLYVNEVAVDIIRSRNIGDVLMGRYTNSRSFDPEYRKSGGSSIAPDLFLVLENRLRFFLEVDCRHDEKDFDRKALWYSKYPNQWWYKAYSVFLAEKGIRLKTKPPKPVLAWVVYSHTEQANIEYTCPKKEISEATRNKELVRTRNALRKLTKFRRIYLIPGHWLKDKKGFVSCEDYKREYDKLSASEALERMPKYDILH